MKYYDYEWDLSTRGIILDNELNVDKLGWQGGDYFKLLNVNGTKMLVKVNDVEKFLLQGIEKREDQNG
jgi:hypothetical protein